MAQNNNCDGSGPHVAGQVRVLPTGGDSNLILCRACHGRELAFRRERNRELGAAERFGLPAWSSLKVYGDDPAVKNRASRLAAIEHDRDASTDVRRRGGARTGWASLAALKAANAAAGMHWFSKDTIRFFKSRVHGDIVAGRYFISSEQPPHGPRFYQIRTARDDATINTVEAPVLGGLNAGLKGYASLRHARAALNKIVEAS